MTDRKPVQIAVDNRLRFDASVLPEGVWEAIRARFRHSNPQHEKLKRMGYFPGKKEPPEYQTALLEGGYASLPRGGMPRLREQLSRAGLAWEVEDRRSTGAGFLRDGAPIPDHRLVLRPYQEEMLEAALARENCLIRAGTGCVAEGTIVHVQRQGARAPCPIEELLDWEMDRRRDPTQLLAMDDEDGALVYRDVRLGIRSGYKLVYELLTEGGAGPVKEWVPRAIRATVNHLFWVKREGREGWSSLEEIEPGTLIAVRGPSGWTGVAWDRVASVKKKSFCKVFDVQMTYAPNNYLANGFVVHNSGKTSVAFAAIARVKVPALVSVWSSNLLDQWMARLESEMGLRPRDVGLVQGSTCVLRPVTMAMQQSLHARFQRGEGEEIARGFGMFIADEVQRAPAMTSFDVTDRFHARYRIGVSASERRKDRKEFLTYDLYGGVANEVSRERLIEEGHVHDVEIRVIPTRFSAPWYRSSPDFNRLLEAMRFDDERNELVLTLAEVCVKAGEQVLLMSHRVEHCRELDQALSGKGIRCGVLLGGKENEEVFRESKAELLSGRYRAAVGTVQAVGQGLDIPRLSRAVACTPLAQNEPQWNQVRGRICRMDEKSGKKDAALYYLWDRAVYGLRALENLIKWNAAVKVFDRGAWVEGRSFVRVARGEGRGR